MAIYLYWIRNVSALRLYAREDLEIVISSRLHESASLIVIVINVRHHVLRTGCFCANPLDFIGWQWDSFRKIELERHLSSTTIAGTKPISTETTNATIECWRQRNDKCILIYPLQLTHTHAHTDDTHFRSQCVPAICYLLLKSTLNNINSTRFESIILSVRSWSWYVQRRQHATRTCVCCWLLQYRPMSIAFDVSNCSSALSFDLFWIDYQRKRSRRPSHSNIINRCTRVLIFIQTYRGPKIKLTVKRMRHRTTHCPPTSAFT